VIGLQPGRDQVIGVEVKNFQSKARKHVSNHFLFYTKSSKMQFSMILAKLKNLSHFSHFGCRTLYCRYLILINQNLQLFQAK
jgi:hypothetical protein